MLKRSIIKKFLIASAVLFTLLLMCLIPNKEELEIKQDLKYVNKNLTTNEIYLIDQNNYLGKTNVVVGSKKQLDLIKELIEILTVDKQDEKIPNGFKAIIPSNTDLKDIELKDGILKLNFTEDLLNISKENESKVIESLIYTLTSIKGVDKIIILINGEVLTKLPKSNITLPSTLDRNYGINKKYNIDSYKDLTSVTLYYLNSNNNDYYYVPVTKYLNTNESKIEVIIEELSNGIYDEKGLVSFLNNDIKLLDNNINENKAELVFNEFIFDNIDNYEISDKVLNAISYSVLDTYDIEEIVFKYQDKEISKTTLKTLE